MDFCKIYKEIRIGILTQLPLPVQQAIALYEHISECTEVFLNQQMDRLQDCTECTINFPIKYDDGCVNIYLKLGDNDFNDTQIMNFAATAFGVQASEIYNYISKFEDQFILYDSSKFIH